MSGLQRHKKTAAEAAVFYCGREGRKHYLCDYLNL
jgi:hypothetical protein